MWLFFQEISLHTCTKFSNSYYQYYPLKKKIIKKIHTNRITPNQICRHYHRHMFHTCIISKKEWCQNYSISMYKKSPGWNNILYVGSVNNNRKLYKCDNISYCINNILICWFIINTSHDFNFRFPESYMKSLSKWPYPDTIYNEFIWMLFGFFSWIILHNFEQLCK